MDADSWCVVRAGRRGQFVGQLTAKRIAAAGQSGLAIGMQTDATLILSALCLGIAITGVSVLLPGHATAREKVSLGLVYGAFTVITSTPLIMSLNPILFLDYLPLNLVSLLVLPPAVYHYVLAKTAHEGLPAIRWFDLMLPALGCTVCLGFWALTLDAKRAMFISGELPTGVVVAILVFATFALILSWLLASLMYLASAVRRLTAYRAHLRQLYSNMGGRELRWVNWLMVLLMALWGVSAVSLAGENLGTGPLFSQEMLYGLTACCLVFLTAFASRVVSVPEPAAEDAPSPVKYARSALSSDHAAKLAARIDAAMRQDALYYDPNLSLQKLSRHVGALPNLVSQTLNEEIGATFFDYVARWRIEASKPLILAGELSVLTVALDVGFNTRSTFYTAFKRETGMTPKAFRASHQL
jgi:AraC-like DNA-binding protein